MYLSEHPVDHLIKPLNTVLIQLYSKSSNLLKLQNKKFLPFLRSYITKMFSTWAGDTTTTRCHPGDVWVIRLKAKHGTVFTHTGSNMLCRCRHRLVVGRIAPTVVVAGVVAFL